MRKQNFRLVIALGTEQGGVYRLAATLRSLGFRCMISDQEQSNLALLRNQRPSTLNFCRVIRRIFADFGLPIISEPPWSRLSAEEWEYYSGTIARSLIKNIESNIHIIADHAASFLLPLIAAACGRMNIFVSYKFLYSNPGIAMADLKEQLGVPQQLSEFVWRNAVSAVARHPSENTAFIDADALGKNDLERLVKQISADTGQEARKPVESGWRKRYTSQLPVLPETNALYLALKSDDPVARNDCAMRNYNAFLAQNGWQFVDCLDCGELETKEDRMLAPSYLPSNPSEEDITPQWEDLLDECERKLLDTRRNYEARLFIHSHSAQRHYEERLAAEKELIRNELAEYQMKEQRRWKRYKNRIRFLFDQCRKNS